MNERDQKILAEKLREIQAKGEEEIIKIVSNSKTHYESLMIDKEFFDRLDEAGKAKYIKKCFYKISMHTHSDRYRGPYKKEEIEELFKKAGEAKDTLIDKKARMQYNLENGLMRSFGEEASVFPNPQATSSVQDPSPSLRRAKIVSECNEKLDNECVGEIKKIWNEAYTKYTSKWESVYRDQHIKKEGERIQQNFLSNQDQADDEFRKAQSSAYSKMIPGIIFALPTFGLSLMLAYNGYKTLKEAKQAREEEKGRLKTVRDERMQELEQKKAQLKPLDAKSFCADKEGTEEAIQANQESNQLKQKYEAAKRSNNNYITNFQMKIEGLKSTLLPNRAPEASTSASEANTAVVRYMPRGGF